MNKKSQRQTIKRLTLALTEADAARQRDRVVASLRDVVKQRRPRVVALFSPLPDEVDISEFVDSLAEQSGVRVVLPRVEASAEKPTMEFYDYHCEGLAVGAYGISEPQGAKPCEVGEIDLMVVPAVAFTLRGERLGRGKGYYDSYLSRDGFRAYTVGVCYEHQVVDSLPTEPHDRLVDEVIAGA